MGSLKRMKTDGSERPEGFDALPKRFKDYIIRLEQDLASVRKTVPSVDSTEGARVKIVDRLYAGNDGFISDQSVIEFPVLVDGKIHEFRAQIARGREGQGVEVSSSTAGIVVYPEVSNVVVVGVRR